MKKLLLILLILPTFAICQEISTTEEEYKYLTEGIREQFSKGLDIKKEGYTLDKFFEVKSKNSDNIYNFYKFINSNGNIKAISIMLRSPDAKPTSGVYYCYPINNEKLLKKHWREVELNLASKNLYDATNQALLNLIK